MPSPFREAHAIVKKRIPGRASLAAQPLHTGLAVPSRSTSHELDDADFRSIFSVANEPVKALMLLLSNFFSSSLYRRAHPGMHFCWKNDSSGEIPQLKSVASLRPEIVKAHAEEQLAALAKKFR
jgi:hypothetical protein